MVAIVAASEITREYLIKQKIFARSYKSIKMVNIAMLIGGALANALAVTSSSYLFHRLSADNIDAERKRHDAAIEALQKAQIEWTHKCQQRIDFINNQLRLL